MALLRSENITTRLTLKFAKLSVKLFSVKANLLINIIKLQDSILDTKLIKSLILFLIKTNGILAKIKYIVPCK